MASAAKNWSGLVTLYLGQEREKVTAIDFVITWENMDTLCVFNKRILVTSNLMKKKQKKNRKFGKVTHMIVARGMAGADPAPVPCETESHWLIWHVMLSVSVSTLLFCHHAEAGEQPARIPDQVERGRAIRTVSKGEFWLSCKWNTCNT